MLRGSGGTSDIHMIASILRSEGIDIGNFLFRLPSDPPINRFLIKQRSPEDCCWLHDITVMDDLEHNFWLKPKIVIPSFLAARYGALYAYV